ncbi:SulP family inorganic anion transporter [Arcobacter cryaerophilus gv. pseudocryaerophilus]
MALAFGVVSGAGAIAGLYGAIILGFIAALLGGISVQVSGPTGPMTVVTAAAIATFPNDFSTVMAVVFFAGIIQISFGIVDLGKWIKVYSISNYFWIYVWNRCYYYNFTDKSTCWSQYK